MTSKLLGCIPPRSGCCFCFSLRYAVLLFSITGAVFSVLGAVLSAGLVGAVASNQAMAIIEEIEKGQNLTWADVLNFNGTDESFQWSGQATSDGINRYDRKVQSCLLGLDDPWQQSKLQSWLFAYGLTALILSVAGSVVCCCGCQAASDTTAIQAHTDGVIRKAKAFSRGQFFLWVLGLIVSILFEGLFYHLCTEDGFGARFMDYQQIVNRVIGLVVDFLIFWVIWSFAVRLIEEKKGNYGRVTVLGEAPPVIQLPGSYTKLEALQQQP